MPPSQVAIFCIGLRENSRVMMKLSNLNVPLETLMLIDIRDKVNLIFWSKTEDATKGKNRPEMLLGKFVDFKEKEEAKSFNSREEFENERKRILGGIN